jgi:hypothetical protein
MHRKLFVFILAVMLATTPLVAGDDVPFKGEALSEMVSFDPATATAVFTVTGGNVTHLGKITGTATVYYDPATWMPTGADLILVAANGDELYQTTTMTGYAVTGGTGRFAGATGSGSFSAVNVGDIEDGIVALEWDGTID